MASGCVARPHRTRFFVTTILGAFLHHHVLHVEIIIETATTHESTKLEKGWLARKGKRRPGLFHRPRLRTGRAHESPTKEIIIRRKRKIIILGNIVWWCKRYMTERDAFVRDPLIVIARLLFNTIMLYNMQCNWK